MSRIRSIHPGIWTDEAFMSLSAHARLLLMGLWTEAWDDGVFEWKPLTLKARIFPVDTVDVLALLEELSASGMIAQMTTSPKPVGAIKNFQKYQRPKKPNSSGMMRDEWREYVGAASTPAPSGDGSSEPVPNQFPNTSEKSPQMEDGGGRMKEEVASQPRVPDLVDRLAEAAGITGNLPQGLAFAGEIIGLIQAGFDLEADILPAIKARPNSRARSWAYFVPQIRDAAARKSAAASIPAPERKAIDWQSRISAFYAQGLWPYSWGPKPGEPGCDAPPELINQARAAA